MFLHKFLNLSGYIIKLNWLISNSHSLKLLIAQPPLPRPYLSDFNITKPRKYQEIYRENWDYLQGDHGGQRLGFVDFVSVVPVHCLFNSALAGENWAEMAEQLGNIVELQEYSQQNAFSDHHGHPVYAGLMKIKIVFVSNPTDCGMSSRVDDAPACNSKPTDLLRY